jgi:2-polyprenyl-3-methyl-5-hydroxy-6-metoxy-1,4-benzoquinol methylase
LSAAAYQERLWEELPEGLLPSDFALRRAFLLAHVVGGERVLDVGCGEGFFASELTRAGTSVIGIDVAEEPLRRARLRDPALELLRVEPDRPWPLADASFDAVWAGEVIEHVLDTAAWLSEVRRVLRSGGTLLVSTPAHGALNRLQMGLSARAFADHMDPLSDHIRFYTRASLSALIASFGFEQLDVRSAGGPRGLRRLLLARALRARF